MSNEYIRKGKGFAFRVKSAATAPVKPVPTVRVPVKAPETPVEDSQNHPTPESNDTQPSYFDRVKGHFSGTVDQD